MASVESVSIAQLILPAAAAIVGVAVGGLITVHSQKKERWHKCVREKLEKFYSLLLAMRMEIRSKSELRVKLGARASTVWQKRIESVARGLEVHGRG